MRLLHNYPTLSHSFLRNATRLFGFRKTYRLMSVRASQRKKNAEFHNEEKRYASQRKKRCVSQRKKDRHVSQRSGLIRKY